MAEIKGMNPLLSWLIKMLSFYATEEIKIPTDFHDQVSKVKDVLLSDISGLVNSMLDFAINSASVDYIVETQNQELNDIIDYWLKNINISVLGRVPTGVKALSKEYYRERWKNSSLIVLRTVWEDVEISGTKFHLPTKMWFVDGANIKVENGDKNTRIIGTEKYSLKITEKIIKSLPITDDEKIFVQKPFNSWSDIYATPFLIQRGIWKNLMVYNLINKKGEQIVGKALEYLLLLKKGSEQLAMKGDPDYVYSVDELKEVKKNFKQMVQDSKTEAGIPTYVTNFDTQLEHLIPEYSKILNSSLYENIEKRLLGGLGLIDIVEGTSSTRRESLLNPKPFISETENGIKDFVSLLSDIITTIKMENISKHRKYMNEDIKLHYPSVKQFITDGLRDHFRSLYDRGLLSKRTYTEIIADFDLDVEIKRRKLEKEDKLDEILYPPLIQNKEEVPDVIGDPENIPDDKKSIEKLNFKSAVLFGVICKKCNTEFDYQNTPEAQMGGTKCPSCGEMLTDKDIDFSKVFEEAPYNKVSDLPDAVKNNMDSDLAQTFLKVVNDAIKKYKNETTAFKMAWAVIRKIAKKDKDGKWVKKTSKSSIEISNIVDESQDPIEKLIQLKKLELLDKQASLLDELSPKENINEGS